MKKRTLYWGAQHLSHNIVAHERGFTSTAAHDAWFIQRWMETVAVHDTVYVLGSISSGSTRYTAGALETLSQLPGHKVLIPGTRDSMHPGSLSIEVPVSAWRAVFEDIRLFDVHSFAGEKFLVSALGYASEDSRDRWTPLRLSDHGLPLVHAEHGHSGFDVSIEAHSTPVTKEEIGAWLSRQRTGSML